MKNSRAIRIKQQVMRFIGTESAGGNIMLLAAFLSMLAANSVTAPWYQSFIHLPVTLGFGTHYATLSLSDWIKDVPMVLFFLLVGLELKRELCEGVLADRSQVLLPLCAALGGMVMPAALFLLVTSGNAEYASGWAIPSATDIAFALCILLLAAKNLPPALKIFLLAIAIFDDLGAILIIALFYGHGFAWMPFALATLCTGVLYLLNRRQVMRLWPYLLIGIVLGAALYQAGIHTTIAGVLVGMAIPLRAPNPPHYSPLNRCLHRLHPWVSFLILPLFAFTAAGVDLTSVRAETLLEPLTLGITLGLFLGKQLGIFGVTWLMVTSGRAALPQGTNWRQIYAVALLAGIGFTMSLFIGSLAFSDAALQEKMKLGVLAGSTLSAITGWGVLRFGRR